MDILDRADILLKASKAYALGCEAEQLGMKTHAKYCFWCCGQFLDLLEE